jgi:hypothetical protein
MNRFSKYIIALLIILSLYFVPGVFAGRPERKTYEFFPTEAPVYLQNLSSIYVGEKGKLAALDSKSQKIQILPADVGQLPEFLSGGIWSDFFDEYRMTEFVSGWAPGGDITGFWDGQGRFWYYDLRAARKNNRFTVKEATGDRTVILNGPVVSVIPIGTHWVIQNKGEIFSRWDPESEQGLVDTFSIEVEGKLMAVSSDEHYFSRQDETLYVYKDGELLNKRKISGLKAADYQSGFLYVLKTEGSILRLNRKLGLEFTFDFISVPDLVDFAIKDDLAYLVGPDGLYHTRLNESGRSFFSSSVMIGLQKVSASFENILKAENRIERLWVGKETYFLAADGTISRGVLHDSPPKMTRKKVNEDEIPLVVFQFFQSDNTFWNGNRLYYYFPGENAVEAYDRRGQVLEQVELKLESERDIQNIDFLGANDELILLEGEMIFPGKGYSPIIIVFDWEGELQRIFSLHYPAGHQRVFQRKPYPFLRFDGKGSIYSLQDSFIQEFDLYGYPRRIISGLDYPKDLMIDEEQLLIVDAGGWRLTSRDLKEPVNIRFATPPEQLTVLDAIEAGDDKILIAGLDESGSAIIYEYEPGSGQYRRALRHPVMDLRHPFVSEGADTLFFWGKNEESEDILYNSDLKRYAATSTGFEADSRGGGLYLEDKGIFLVPVSNGEKSEMSYEVLSGEVRNPLLNSRDLIDIEKGGFAGYYGAVRTGTGTLLVSGYLERENDTGPWIWQVDEKIKFIDSPVNQIVNKNGILYLALEKNKSTQLAELDLSSRSDTNLKIKLEAYGSLRWVTTGDDRALILQRQKKQWGRLLFVSFGPFERGGLRGTISADEPVDLGGIELVVQPGGKLIRTDVGGGFSFDGVGDGYVQIFPTSYRYHFRRPYSAFVHAGEFNVNLRPELYPTEPLSWLERGRQKFQEQSYRVALIAFKAFRTLAGGGPYHDWGTAMLEEIYWRQENFEELGGLYREKSDYFSPEEKHRLLKKTSDRNLKVDLMKDLLPFSNYKQQELINYRLLLLKTQQDAGLDFIFPPPPVWVNNPPGQSSGKL